MGKFETFKEDEETGESYIERFEMFVVANKIADEDKKAYLISSMGLKTYALLKNLAAPMKPSDLQYINIKEYLKKNIYLQIPVR